MFQNLCRGSGTLVSLNYFYFFVLKLLKNFIQTVSIDSCYVKTCGINAECKLNDEDEAICECKKNFAGNPNEKCGE